MQKWCDKENSENQLGNYKSKQFIDIIIRAKAITNFDIDLFFKLVEKLTVCNKEMVIVTFLDGIEIERKIGA